MKTKSMVFIVIAFIILSIGSVNAEDGNEWYEKSAAIFGIELDINKIDKYLTQKEFYDILVFEEKQNDIEIEYDAIQSSNRVNRLDVATILSERIIALGNNEEISSMPNICFNDINQNEWDMGIDILVKYAIAFGDEQNQFKPYECVNYQEAYIMIGRYINHIISKDNLEKYKYQFQSTSRRMIFQDKSDIYFIKNVWNKEEKKHISKLYLTDTEFKNQTFIRQEILNVFSVEGDYIYYYGDAKNRGTIYRMNKKTYDTELLVDSMTGSFVVTSDFIYYFDYTYDALMRYNIANGYISEIIKGKNSDENGIYHNHYWYVDGNWIYYQSIREIYKVSIDGTKKIKLSFPAGENWVFNSEFDIYKDKIYFIYGQAIYMSDTNFENMKYICDLSKYAELENFCDFILHIRGDWAYLSFYRVNLKDGSIEKALNDFSILIQYGGLGLMADEYNFYYLDDYYYFYNSYLNGYYRVDYKTGNTELMIE